MLRALPPSDDFFSKKNEKVEKIQESNPYNSILS
jgi:hypothetical protein